MKKNLEECLQLEADNEKYNKLDCFYDNKNNLMKNLLVNSNVQFEYNIIENWRDEGVI